MNNNTVIHVSNVSKAVGERQLLRDISFDIDAQSLVALIGPNGAGKSTLLKIILGLDTQYSGTVVVRSSEKVQYIPQISTSDHHQLPLSVSEYLRIGTTPLYRGASSPVDFTAALKHVGVSEDVLTQSYRSLSGGERQRVAIARALLAEPTVLVLDEPLAAVDYGSRPGLYELIRHLQSDHGLTVLLVSHDVDSVLPISDRVLCLNKTLHTDCHPSEFDSAHLTVPSGIVHNC
jgi:zinc transport system ATP-binding protein